MDVPGELRAERARRKQTQALAAQCLGVSLSTYRRWEEGGPARLSPAQLSRLAEYLRIESAKIWCGS